MSKFKNMKDKEYPKDVTMVTNRDGVHSRQAEIDNLQNRIDDLKSFCIKGVESNMLSIEYNQALIDMHKILKGEETK